MLFFKYLFELVLIIFSLVLLKKHEKTKTKTIIKIDP